MIDEQAALQDLLQKGIRLPPQPDILLELNERMQDGNYDAASLATLIARDAGISGMLFKVAASPLFCRASAPDTLEKVLVRLGLKQTINLVRAIAISNKVPAASRLAFHRFWTRSREIAQLAAIIAEDRVTVCNIFPDQAYMTGIFLECGVPVLMQRFPDYANALLAEGFDQPSVKEEDKRFNVDHCTIGYLVARHWRLPNFVAQAILRYNEVPHEDLGEVRTVVAILQLAIHCHADIHRSSNPTWDTVGADALDELGLRQAALTGYMADIREAFLLKGI
ncbi:MULTISPECIES: HDOD domain-containing protein [Aquaspirillum]|uniref:HDOD domain-containing protein n=1 Tax=Aquaspirillum serpens TaxID=190 RepID=UPI0003B3AA32|nr:HDOD domain-containing protein [Aquaspirillum serpens]